MVANYASFGFSRWNAYFAVRFWRLRLKINRLAHSSQRTAEGYAHNRYLPSLH